MSNPLQHIDALKTELNQYRSIDSHKVATAFEIEYTYESNRIEGNTLTLQETALVIEKGLTISGKSLQEHLEAINHTHAIDYVREIVKDKIPFDKIVLLNIHKLILQGIDNTNAGIYRNVQVLISGSKHTPPQPFLVAEAMDNFFSWYNENKEILHPIVLAAEAHERLVTIHPFIDGNGRTSRLLMNLILLQHGYPIAIIKGDTESRLKYYDALEAARTENNKQQFIDLVVNSVTEALEKVLKTLRG